LYSGNVRVALKWRVYIEALLKQSYFSHIPFWKIGYLYYARARRDFFKKIALKFSVLFVKKNSKIYFKLFSII